MRTGGNGICSWRVASDSSMFASRGPAGDGVGQRGYLHMSRFAKGTVCVHRRIGCLVQLTSESYTLGDDRRPMYSAAIWYAKRAGMPLVVSEMYLAPLDFQAGSWDAVIFDELGWREGRRMER